MPHRTWKLLGDVLIQAAMRHDVDHLLAAAEAGLRYSEQDPDQVHRSGIALQAFENDTQGVFQQVQGNSECRWSWIKSLRREIISAVQSFAGDEISYK